MGGDFVCAWAIFRYRAAMSCEYLIFMKNCKIDEIFLIEKILHCILIIYFPFMSLSLSLDCTFCSPDFTDSNKNLIEILLHEIRIFALHINSAYICAASNSTILPYWLSSTYNLEMWTIQFSFRCILISISQNVEI